MSRKGELPLYKKFFISLLVVMLVFISTGMGVCAAHPVYTQPNMFVIYPQDNIQNNAIVRMLSAEEEKLTSEGFTVISVKPDINKLVQQTHIVPANQQTELQDCTISKVAAIEVEVDTESYYFKSEADAASLIEKLDRNEVEYEKSETEINVKQISKAEKVNEEEIKLDNEYQAEQERLQKEREEKVHQTVKVAVTSRGGIERTSSGTAAVNGNYCFPLASYVYVSSPYGPRWGKTHTGIDLAAAAGTHIYAWKSGTVVTACWNGGYGNFIEVQHADGTSSRYAHLSGYACSVGDYVSIGELIGYVGTTGNSTR